ncbi:MAG: hypothetical protein QG633_598 [Patescibacteria group bacterium]|jgi:hypothetical protein|nr:hypothetical protein [Patescibacteria group bacterium]
MPQGTPISKISSPGATPRAQVAPINGGESNAGATSQPSSAVTSETPQTKNVREPRISNISAIKMVAAGILLDLVALIPFVGGYAAEIIGGLTFFLWFLILGLPLMSPKTLTNWALNLIVGETATAGAWPGFTIGAILTVVMTRTEDKTGLDVMSLTKGDVKSLGEVGKNLSGQVQARFTGGASQGGATPAPKTPTDENATKDVNPVTASREEHPVTASERAHYAAANEPVAQGATPQTPKSQEIIDARPGAQEAQNLEKAARQNNLTDIRPGAQEARNLKRALGNKVIPFPGSGSPDFGRGSRYEERGEGNEKTNSMSIHDELWELNAKPDLDKNDKERLLKAHWIMEHRHIEEKEKNDPVLLRAWERVQRGEVAFDGSPEKRHGFVFKNVQIANAIHTAAGRDFDSLNPQYGKDADGPATNTGATPRSKAA